MQSILEEAAEVISGPRKESYGEVRLSFTRIAVGWTSITGQTISPEQVCLMMIWLKVCREVASHSRDNLVDIAGYDALLEQLTEPSEDDDIDKARYEAAFPQTTI